MKCFLPCRNAFNWYYWTRISIMRPNLFPFSDSRSITRSCCIGSSMLRISFSFWKCSLFIESKTISIQKLFRSNYKRFRELYLCVLRNIESKKGRRRKHSLRWYKMLIFERLHQYQYTIILHVGFTLNGCCPFISWHNECWQLWNLTPQMASFDITLDENIFFLLIGF